MGICEGHRAQREQDQNVQWSYARAAYEKQAGESSLQESGSTWQASFRSDSRLGFQCCCGTEGSSSEWLRCYQRQNIARQSTLRQIQGLACCSQGRAASWCRIHY